MNLKISCTVLAAMLYFMTPAGAQVAASDTDDDGTAEGELSTITVVGTRTEKTLKEVAATVSVISAEQIEQQLARDISDLVRYEPGVTVAGTGSRFGLSGVSIRGIGGNRVLTMVDGIRLPDEFSFGPFLSARRDFMDVDSLARAEIARGPVSSLYGSDAIGGVVAFTTRKPADFLTADDSFYSGLKAGYSSADESAVGTLTLAGGGESVSGMLLYTHRDGSEAETQGSVGSNGPDRELADPQDITSDNVVAKLSFVPADGHQVILGIDYFDNETETQVLSDYGISVFGTTIDSRDAIDTRERTRAWLQYEFEGDIGIADTVFATIYDQSSETKQSTFEQRTTPAFASQSRERISYFDQDIQGAYLQFGKSFEAGDSEHLLTFGAEYYTTDNSSLRDGGTFDDSGEPVPEFSPLPTRDFPLTETDQLALFIQDEITFLDGRLVVSPGLRFDSFDASARADDVYLNGNPGSPDPVDFDDSEVTGRVGMVYSFSESVSGFAQYSQGFRAPPYDDVNVGFTNFIGGYKTISNPDLKSERSDGIELGLRFQGNTGSASFAVFRTEYDDFIESLSIAPQFLPSGIDPADDLLTFQSINVDQVTIDGAEFAGELRLGAFSDAMDGYSLRAAIAYADGEDDATGEPLESVEPLTGVIGILFDAPSGRWGAELAWTLVDSKDQGDLPTGSIREETAGYGILDLMAYARFSEQVSLNVGLFNLTDKTYIRWADTAAIGTDARLRFSQPGFNAAATLRVEF